jgi:hypothetical protein
VTVYGFHTGAGLSPRVTGAFCRGARARLQHVSTFFDSGLPSDASAVAMYAILRGTGLIFREAQRRNVDFYYIDHAYLTQSAHWLGVGRPDRWFRVARNGHAINDLRPGSDNRFRRYFAKCYPLLPWRGNSGGAILVLPPTPAIRWFFGCNGWGETIVRNIRRFTDRPIIWREKPGAKNVDEKGNPDGSLSSISPPEDDWLTTSSGSLQADLDRALAVVCYNSNAAVEAIRQGIPVNGGEHCAAYPLRFGFDALADPEQLRCEPDRPTWFAHLANHQFSLAELTNGNAWKLLRSGGTEATSLAV